MLSMAGVRLRTALNVQLDRNRRIEQTPVLQVIMSGCLELPNENGEAQTGKEGEGQFHPVVRVELDFREKVAGGNTKESARGERQGGAEDGAGLFRGSAKSQKKDPDPAGNREGEQSIHDVAGIPGVTARRHQGANRHRIEGLVQENDQERPQSPKQPGMAVGIGVDAGRQGQAVEQGMERHPGRRPDPREPTR